MAKADILTVQVDHHAFQGPALAVPCMYVLRVRWLLSRHIQIVDTLMIFKASESCDCRVEDGDTVFPCLIRSCADGEMGEINLALVSEGACSSVYTDGVFTTRVCRVKCSPAGVRGFPSSCRLKSRKHVGSETLMTDVKASHCSHSMAFMSGPGMHHCKHL